MLLTLHVFTKEGLSEDGGNGQTSHDVESRPVLRMFFPAAACVLRNLEVQAKVTLLASVIYSTSQILQAGGPAANLDGFDLDRGVVPYQHPGEQRGAALLCVVSCRRSSLTILITYLGSDQAQAVSGLCPSFSLQMSLKHLGS